MVRVPRLNVRGKVVRIALAGLALTFFFGPAVAAAAGVRAPAIENHKLGRLPDTSNGWKSFGIFDTWATDHLPLRNVAISANTKVERDVFGETPNYGANGTATTTTATGVAGISVPQPPRSARERSTGGLPNRDHRSRRLALLRDRPSGRLQSDAHSPRHRATLSATVGDHAACGQAVRLDDRPRQE